MTWSSKKPQPRVSNVQSTLAPVGGLNDIDSLAAMEPGFCLSSINWIPGNSVMQARQGYREWCTGLDGPVKTIMGYAAMSGDVKIFASTDAGIYDVTATMVGPPLVHTGGVGLYNHTMFGSVAMQYLVAVSQGSDPSLFYDGTSWNSFVEATAPAAPGEIKGVDPNTFNHVAVFKRRLWFVQEGTTTAWYLPVDSVGGEAKPFYLSSIFKRGGWLLYMVDWSVDGGDGLDDKLLFVSNLGEVAVYHGDDPDNTETWALESLFYMSAPIGPKSFTEFGGDVLMVTHFGLIPLTKVLVGRLQETPMEAALTKRISRTINRLINSLHHVHSWEVHNVPNYQVIAILIPPHGEDPAIQLVMNSLSGSWTRLDLPMNCGGVVSNKFYFGDVDGRVLLYGEQNYLDDVKINNTGGVPIQCSLFTAYNYYGDPTTLKHFKLIRPIFQTDQPPSYKLTINVDFDTAALPGNPSPPGPDADNPLWDSAIWDASFWAGGNTVFRPWVGVSGLGFCSALLLKLASNDLTTFVAYETVYEKGGAI